MLGDSAGLITPLCGNGMSMAMHSSKIAFTAIGQFLERRISRNEMERLYTKEWQKEFSSRLIVGRTVQTLFGGNTSTSVFLKLMKFFPTLSGQLIRSTHGKPF
jgi:flavin-dependent dehydrogenase